MRRERSKTHAASSQPRTARRVPEQSGDVYASHGKLREPSACRSCGAIYRNGRWIWDADATVGIDVMLEACPACRRIADDYPAGIVSIEGDFLAAHRAEIEQLVRNVEQHERAEHPLVRIFGIEESEAGVCVPTTDARLARAIGRALQRAYRGELDEPDPASEEPIRVRWTRG